MAMRVYIVAAESGVPLTPSFKAAPGDRFQRRGAFETMDWSAFAALKGSDIRAIVASLARELGRPELTAELAAAPAAAPSGLGGEDCLPEERG